MKSYKVKGKCKCGRLITKKTNDETMAGTDKNRYTYTEGKSKYTNDGRIISNGKLMKYYIFRCEDCTEVISENWVKL